MIRRYCDGCGDLLDEKVVQGPALEFKLEEGYHHSEGWPKSAITVRTTRAVDDTWNGGDVCRDCLVKVISVAHEAVQVKSATPSSVN